MSEPLSTVATSIVATASKDIATTASKGIGQTVSDIWYVVFGAEWDEKRQKKQLEVAHNVEKFKEEITNKSAQIPDENRIEPDIDVVGATLESAKFRINKDEIRDMFSNLITSAMDSSKADDIHPSFSEMIKMLSPLDAQNLHYLFHNGDETISKIIINLEKGGYQEKYTHIYLGNPKCQRNELIEPSIDNLIRLKLVDVSYTEYKTAENAYTAHLENPLYIALKADVADKINRIKSDIDKLSDPEITQVMHNNKILSDNERLALKESLEKNLFKDVELQQGVIRLTALGRNFCKVCL